LTESRLSILVHYSSKKNPTGFGTKFDWKIWVHAFHALKREPDTGSKTMKTSTKSKMEHKFTVWNAVPCGKDDNFFRPTPYFGNFPFGSNKYACSIFNRSGILGISV
jgi:hypothetical protein